MIDRVTVTRAELLQALEGGALVLTGNARLSRSLRAEYDHAMLVAGRHPWRGSGCSGARSGRV